MDNEQSRRATRDNLGFLLAKALERWNELLALRFSQEGYPEVRPAFGSLLLPLFEEDGLRIGELAKRARLSKQNMTTALRAMEDAGLIQRVSDPRDSRATRVYLTARARSFAQVVEHVLGELDALVESKVGSTYPLKASLKALMDLEFELSQGE